MTVNPMHKAPRCHAHSKRTGEPCRSPAVKGWKVCRIHGAGGGAPCGPRNGNYRHGGRTTESEQRRKQVRDLLRAMSESMEALI